MNSCMHPEERRFAWTYYDPREEGDYLAMVCTVCGEVLCGAGDLQGNPVGPQHRLSPIVRKRKSRKAKEGKQ